jgi:hypothetical protein
MSRRTKALNQRHRKLASLIEHMDTTIVARTLTDGTPYKDGFCLKKDSAWMLIRLLPLMMKHPDFDVELKVKYKKQQLHLLSNEEYEQRAQKDD